MKPEHLAALGERFPLSVDEKCWQIRESDHPSTKPGGGMRRIQRVWVVRDDTLCEFDKDLGPAWAFPLAKPFIFVAGNEYSVGESLEQADCLRESQPTPEEPHDLMRQWYQELDEKRQLRKHKSVIGPHQRIQRD